MFNVSEIRSQFPALNDNNLVYLDSTSTTQKPQRVLDALTHYYTQSNANVHRGSHSLTAQATTLFEDARQTVADFIHARSTKEVIWTRGTTEAINLIAQSYARNQLQAGDEIVIGEMEHHANIVPWQMVAEQTGAQIIKVPMQADCTISAETYFQHIGSNTKIVCIGHISNVTGTRHPIEQVIQYAHQHSAVVVVDGAQAIAHEKVDVQKLDADFYVFSGHKMFAPTGIGVLYAKQALLEAMPPWHGGGKMVDKVSFEQTRFQQLPAKFEAGTPNTAGAIALATAIKWMQQIDFDNAEQYVQSLQRFAFKQLSQIEEINIIGYQPNSSIITFVVDGVHHQDIAMLLDKQGIAVRAGHHCAHPMMDALGVKGTVRASFALYNTKKEVEQFVAAVAKSISML